MMIMRKAIGMMLLATGAVLLYSYTQQHSGISIFQPEENKIRKETAETKPVWSFLFDDLLADGFTFPVNMNLNTNISSLNGKTFPWKLLKDSSLLNNNSQLFYLDKKKTHFFNLTAPAPCIVTSVEKDSVANCYVIITEHRLVENAKYCKLEFEYRGVDSVLVKEKDTLSKNMKIGRIGKWKYNNGSAFALRLKRSFPYLIPWHFSTPAEFCKNYKSVPLPKNENDLLVAIKHEYKMYHFKKGKLHEVFEIALSQDPVGHKQKQGDNKTAEGEYYISEKKKGPFYGDTGPWLGNSWMQFSYPNRFDAWEGYKRGEISLNECNSIVTCDKNKQPTLSYTNLGGRVGLHGWNGDWIADGSQNLTWGCLSMHNNDIDRLYEIIPLGTKLLILP